MTQKILFVDDEKQILTSLNRVFMDEPFEVFTADSGIKALEILKNERMDLVVSDQRMPEMNGVEFLKRSKKYSPHAVRIILTGYADIDVAISSINEGEVYRYITKPWNNEELKATIHDALELLKLRKENSDLLKLNQMQNLELKDLNANLEKKVKAQTNELRDMYDELKGFYDKLDKGFIESVKVFSNLVRLRKRSISLHHMNTTIMAKAIAQKMGLSDAAIKDIEIAALLHDIGKIGMNDTILNKAFANMYNTERIVFEKHPVLGQVLLQSIETMQNVSIIIRHHHERWDGDGYPDKIKGNKIPIGSRIIAVASDYDALINGRLLESKLDSLEAKEFIINNSGQRYSPQIIKLSSLVFIEQEKLLKNRPEFKIISTELKKGMVVSKDIYTEGGFLLVLTNTILTQKHIENIINFEEADGKRYNIYVQIKKQKTTDLGEQEDKEQEDKEQKDKDQKDGMYVLINEPDITVAKEQKDKEQKDKE